MYSNLYKRHIKLIVLSIDNKRRLVVSALKTQDIKKNMLCTLCVFNLKLHESVISTINNVIMVLMARKHVIRSSE